MYRVVFRLLIVLLCLIVLSGGNVHAAWNKTLVTIDGQEYTDQDYREWWRHWREPGMGFFDSPQEFIDFHLLAEQGRQMEYHLTPEYQRRVIVFLKVRSLTALKREEVDTKIKISEDQIRAIFDKKYSPVWTMQVLSYDEDAKAGAVFEKLKDFNGQRAGRLVFADLAGVKPEDGGPVSYEEVEVNPSILAKVASGDKWLEVISALEKNSVAEPLILEEAGRYVVIRLDDISSPGEEKFKKLRGPIRKKLARKEGAKLTGKLMVRLREKYHVRVDEDLLQSVSLQGDYQKEFLAKAVVEMDGLSMSVNMLIYNVKQQRVLRRSLSDEDLKRLVVNTFISNSLTDSEALARHYEKKPPIKGVYEFYKDNNLRKFLNEGIRKRIVVKDSEIRDYFDGNRSEYTQPEKISYVIIEGHINLLNEISRAISQGADFFDQARDHSFDAQIKTEEAGSIQAELLGELAKLRKGETGTPFPFMGRSAMIRLVDRVEPRVAPFDKVRDGIKGVLREKKYLEAKAAYLEKARSVAEVKVNQRVWKKIKKEYKNANDL